MFSCLYSKAVCQTAENTTTNCQPNGGGLVSSLVAPRRIAAAAIAEGESCEFGSSYYFALCGLGGVLSCGLTHTMVTPLDLVKCRIQVDPAKYRNVVHGFKVIILFIIKKSIIFLKIYVYQKLIKFKLNGVH